MKPKQINVAIFVLSISISLATLLFANSYSFYNGKIHPSRSNKAPLSNAVLADATFANQERIDALNSELKRTQRDLKNTHSYVKKLESELERFKNFYFRKM